MKNKTIVNIMAMAQTYNNEIMNGMPPLISDGGVLKFPTDEKIYKYREQRQKEYKEWLEKEIEECENE